MGLERKKFLAGKESDRHEKDVLYSLADTDIC